MLKVSHYTTHKALVMYVKLNIMVLDEKTDLFLGRPWLTMIVDSSSMYPLGMYIHFEPPSYNSVMLALKHAIEPKNDIKKKYPSIKNEWHASGLPEALCVDNGKEFQGKQLKEACHKLNIHLDYTSMTPGAIEEVERFINVKIEKLKQKTLSISMKSLPRLIHKWLLDDYSVKYNANTKGIPAVIWRKTVKSTPIKFTTDFEELLLLLLEKRTTIITKTGIYNLGLTYLSSDLLNLSVKLEKWGHNKKVLFRYASSDLSKIYVYDKFDKKHLTIPCTNIEYTKDLNLHTHVTFLNDLKKKKVNKDGYKQLEFYIERNKKWKSQN